MATELTTIEWSAAQVDLIKRTINDPITGCLIWQGAKSKLGYAVVERNNRNKYVHRLIMDAPLGTVVRHTCDNPPCINPAHLIIGTQKDNIADAVQKNRMARGQRLPHTKLSAFIVRLIRCAYKNGHISQQKLAAQYSVHQVTISRIVRRIDWRHV